jgi:O-antigen/teichoic acid export membrane protein
LGDEHKATPTPAPASAQPPACDSLAESVVLMLVLLVTQRLVGLVRGVLVCRWLEPSELGQWDLTLAFLSMVAPLAVLGLPGSFGRYVERYRRQGHLRTLLRRATIASATVTIVVVAALAWRPDLVSQWAFGRPDQVALAWLMAASLAAVVAFNYLNDLFTALRRARLVSRLQLLHTLLFALLAVALAAVWQASAAAVLLAYGLACLAPAALGAVVLARDWTGLGSAGTDLPHRALWGTLVPFAAWVWITNAVANLFVVADRYVIVHAAGLAEDQAMLLVGNLHSARVLPALLASIAAALAAIILPHLSHDWEGGRREEVARRVNLMLKVAGFGLAAAGVGVLIAAPLLFDTAFGGKYAGGEAVLPWTLLAGVWMGMVNLVYTYLWCAEKAGRGSLAILAGIVASVGLNLWLVPALGLQGAVIGTAGAQGLVLVLIYLFCRPLGLQVQAGTWLATAVPLVLLLPVWAALAVLASAVLLVGASPCLLRPEERLTLKASVRQYVDKLRRFRSPPQSAPT